MGRREPGDEQPEPLKGLKLGSNRFKFAFRKGLSGSIVKDWLWGTRFKGHCNQLSEILWI